jgi:GTP pyrophosphokinase
VEDRKGLLAEISAKIADVNTNITSVEARSHDGHLDHIDMTLEIHDLKHLEKVLKSLRKVPGVLDVERASPR